MPYCKNCGAELANGSAYCPNCGKPIRQHLERISKLELAGWGERFVAWVLDLIIISVILVPLKIFTWITWPSYVWAPYVPRWIPFIDFGLDNIILFLYWTVMEGIYGKSIGKMAMKIQVTQRNGNHLDIIRAAIESVGKAFLLPLDCLVGWLLYPTNRQRLFNYISETIVIKS